MLATDNSAGADSDEDWEAKLSKEDRDTLDKLISKLHKASKKEVDLAAEDGDGEQNFFRKEYASKISHVLKKFKSKAEANANDADSSPEQLSAKNGDASASDPLLMLATDNSAGADSDEDWEAKLSKEDRDTLDKLISKLHKASKKEVDLAAEDGDGEQNFFRKEYASKIGHVLKDFKQKAEQNNDAGSGISLARVLRFADTDLLAMLSVSLVVATSLLMFKKYGVMYFRQYRNRSQVALLDDAAHV